MDHSISFKNKSSANYHNRYNSYTPIQIDRWVKRLLDGKVIEINAASVDMYTNGYF